MLHVVHQGDIQQKERADAEAFKRARSAAAFSVNHKIGKAIEMTKLLRALKEYHHIFSQSDTILEIGGGTCWAGYLVKSLFPESTVISSDVVPEAVQEHTVWETFFDTRPDHIIACKSYEIPLAKASVDLAFCFEAAHHFGKHRTTLSELHRIVRPGGHVLYLEEPTCTRFLYKYAHRRVNKKREQDGVAEDVLIRSQILKLAADEGFSGAIFLDTHIINRGEIETIYYLILKKIPFLQRFLPCGANVVLKKL